ncbi:hypothetical protein CBL_05434 [Carabus blaptoides fortunei]
MERLAPLSDNPLRLSCHHHISHPLNHTSHHTPTGRHSSCIRLYNKHPARQATRLPPMSCHQPVSEYSVTVAFVYKSLSAGSSRAPCPERYPAREDVHQTDDGRNDGGGSAPPASRLACGDVIKVESREDDGRTSERCKQDALPVVWC